MLLNRKNAASDRIKFKGENPCNVHLKLWSNGANEILKKMWNENEPSSKLLYLILLHSHLYRYFQTLLVGD